MVAPTVGQISRFGLNVTIIRNEGEIYPGALVSNAEGHLFPKRL
jgi:hypothetical protein